MSCFELSKIEKILKLNLHNSLISPSFKKLLANAKEAAFLELSDADLFLEIHLLVQEFYQILS